MVGFDLSTPRERCYYLRNLLDLTQYQFSKVLNVSIRTIHNWECNKPTISHEVFERFCELGINPVYIFLDGNIFLDGQSLNTVKININSILNNYNKGEKKWIP